MTSESRITALEKKVNFLYEIFEKKLDQDRLLSSEEIDMIKKISSLEKKLEGIDFLLKKLNLTSS